MFQAILLFIYLILSIGVYLLIQKMLHKVFIYIKCSMFTRSVYVLSVTELLHITHVVVALVSEVSHYIKQAFPKEGFAQNSMIMTPGYSK